MPICSSPWFILRNTSENCISLIKEQQLAFTQWKADNYLKQEHCKNYKFTSRETPIPGSEAILSCVVHRIGESRFQTSTALQK